MVTGSAVSARKVNANRKNAEHSTGPRTAEGKARASGNAVVHGFYSSRLLLDGEDAAELEQLRHELVRDLRPQGSAEHLIVEQLIAAQWKLRRLHEVEQQMIQSQMESFRKRFGPADAVPAATIERMIYSGNELDRLSIYARRLEGAIHRCHRELRLLRKDRAAQSDDDVQETNIETENVRNEPTASDESSQVPPLSGDTDVTAAQCSAEWSCKCAAKDVSSRPFEGQPLPKDVECPIR